MYPERKTMYRRILIMLLAGALTAGFSGTVYAQKTPPKPDASNLNGSKSNINRIQPAPPAGIHDQWDTKTKAPVAVPNASNLNSSKSNVSRIVTPQLPEGSKTQKLPVKDPTTNIAVSDPGTEAQCKAYVHKKGEKPRCD